MSKIRVVFIGVGEACDEFFSNTSLLVEGPVTILCDCGFTAAPPYWAMAHDPLALDAVCISHFHGDHFFGLPQLLLRLREAGRERELVVIGPEGVAEVVTTAVRLAYKSLIERPTFPLRFLEAVPGTTIRLGEAELDVARPDHSSPSLAVRVRMNGKSVFYSGDGRATPETLRLAAGSDMIVHEAFGLTPGTPGHGSVPEAVEFARAAGARILAVVHLERDVRREHGQAVEKLLAAAPAPLRAVMPEPGERYILG